ncbi:FBA_3 domain-containing protein [Caenorhabditis elegans]|uniref:FBA_3 domain-containing protein n=1 Tax=Caenorhabditis elegans TaxID=6239 RepID=K8F7Y5_CAEEL|nr:FBA_3 domain-containing protein [Caenorhabditis elegans]CCO25651.1 FBA_3 domain-containing protein [Caenorhabditis elegans]|eukprot:NP_001263721.1 Uncharacterized protein CELE_C50C3.19 [Caenorhabditis elegans]
MQYKSHVVCSVCSEPKPSKLPFFHVKLAKGKSFTDMVLQKPWQCMDHLGKSAMIEKKIIADKFNSNFIWFHVDSDEGRCKQMRMKDNQEFIIFGEHCRLVGFLDVKIVPGGNHVIAWIQNGGVWSRVSDHHKKKFWSTSFDMDSLYTMPLFLFERK